MARIFAPPAGMDPPQYDSKKTDWREHAAAEEQWVKDLARWCVDNCPPGKGGDLVGKEVMTGRGDGYARYLVCQQKPLHLIHLPIGDCWRAEEPWERGLRVSDVREMIDREEGLRKLFSGS